MAVVSISRIQVRRGQKNTGSGLPQLASGEFGWAVDSQELFIGNGSVAEGAPYVGNTKMLTENDNLFEFANTYSYKDNINVQTGSSANNPVLRTLQARLDDRVSIRSFGANGDGTNQTVALQRAIDQLYLNASNKGTPQARVELIIDPGEYTITSTIYLPPFTTIRGAGKDKTIINAGDHVAFQTVNETSTPGVYASDSTSTTLNQARNISISGLTINTTQGPGLNLVSCKDSKFTDIVLSGDYNLGDAIDADSNGIKLTSLSTAVSSNNNLFTGVEIRKFATAVYSDNDIASNTWSKCTFDTLYQGFAFGVSTILGTSGMLTGPINNRVIESKFDNIWSTAIHIENGTENSSQHNKYYNVGNNGGSASLNQHPVIKLVSIRNASTDDWFQRSEELGYNETYKNNVRYQPEVKGPVITEFGTTHKLSLNNSGEFTKLFRLPAETTKGYEIDYIYKSNIVDATRIGTMTLVVDPVNDTYNFSDEYDYTGNIIYSEQLSFDANLYDEDGDTNNDTVSVMMQNLTANSSGTISGIALTNPVVVTTSNDPNLTSGQQILITGVVGTTQLNNNRYYVDNVTNTGGTTYTFELYTDISLSTSVNGGVGFTPWTSGGNVSNSDNASFHYRVKTKS
jgi:hypothetical protein